VRHQRRLGFRVTVLFLGFVLALLQSRLRADATATIVPLPTRLWSAAIASKLGTIATVDPARSEVVFYPQLGAKSSADGATHLPVSGTPICIVHKDLKDKSYFIVACRQPNVIHLIDDRTLQIVRSITLAGDLETIAAASDPAAPWVYYITQSRQENLASIGRIDSQTFSDEPGQLPSHDNANDMVVSADGLTIFARRMHTGPKGFFAFDATAWPQVKRVAYLHTDSGPYAADPHGQYIASAKSIWLPDLSRSVVDLNGRVALIVPEKALIFTLTDALNIFSYNSFHPIQTIALKGNAAAATPAAPGRRTRTSAREDSQMASRFSFERPLLYDAKDNAAILLEDAQATVISLQGVTGIDEPVLAARLEQHAILPVGVTTKIRVIKSDPQSRLELRTAPKGMTLQNDQLVWTPTAEDVGAANITVDVGDGPAHREQELHLEVGRTAIQLPFNVMTSVVSEEGHYALARELRASRPPGAQREPDTSQTRLALVDLQKLSIVADKTVPFDVQYLAVDSNYAYAIPMNAQVIEVLSLKDLSSVRKIFAPQWPGSLHSVAGVLYVGQAELPARFKVPELQLLPALPTVGGYNEPEFGHVWPVAVDGGLLFRGVVYDPQMNKVVRAIQPEPIASIGLELTARTLTGGVRPVAGLWGLASSNLSVLRETGPYAAQLRGVDPVVPTDLPVIAMLQSPNPDRVHSLRPVRVAQPDANSDNKWSILLTDASTQTIQRTLPLCDEAPHAGDGYPSIQMQSDLYAAGGKFVARILDRIFVVDSRQAPVSDIKPPLALSLDGAALVVRNGRAAGLAHAHGGNGPYTFHLDSLTPGAAVDASTGQISFDAAAMKVKPEEILAGAARMREQGEAKPEDQLGAYIKSAGAMYMAITGQPTNDPPLAVPLQISATDRDQQTAVLRLVALITAPRAAVLQVMTRPPTYPVAPPIPRGYYPPTQPGSPATMPGYVAAPTASSDPASQVQVLRRQMIELQRRNIELEAQNRMLREMVMQHGGPTTNPTIR
jgi:hypothetical protein